VIQWTYVYKTISFLPANSQHIVIHMYVLRKRIIPKSIYCKNHKFHALKAKANAMPWRNLVTVKLHSIPKPHRRCARCKSPFFSNWKEEQRDNLSNMINVHLPSNVNFVKLAIFHKPKKLWHISSKRSHLRPQTRRGKDFGFRPCVLNRAKVMEYLQFNKIFIKCISVDLALEYVWWLDYSMM